MTVRPRVLLLLGLLLASYLGVLLFFFVNQAGIVFQPETGATPLPSSGDGAVFEAVRFPSGDGTPLRSWLLRPPPTHPPEPWILVLHGNAGNLATPGRPEHDRQLHRLGLGVLALDYRGYGESGGTPSEAGLYADARAAYDYLRDSLHVPADRIVIYGHSLGSGVAFGLASGVPAAGLIVEGAFTSVPDRGAEIYPWLPIRWLATIRFPSLDRVRTLTLPILVIHGRDDSTIPVAHGRRLFAAARGPRQFLEVAGGHDDAFEADAPAYEAGIRRFLETLFAPGTP